MQAALRGRTVLQRAVGPAASLARTHPSHVGPARDEAIKGGLRRELGALRQHLGWWAAGQGGRFETLNAHLDMHGSIGQLKGNLCQPHNPSAKLQRRERLDRGTVTSGQG